jgi:hypothetical protein
MSDEELAVLILETRDRTRTAAWLLTDEVDGAWRDIPRAREHMTTVVREVRHRLEGSQREQTAATILAALIITRIDGKPDGRPDIYAKTAVLP